MPRGVRISLQLSVLILVCSLILLVMIVWTRPLAVSRETEQLNSALLSIAAGERLVGQSEVDDEKVRIIYNLSNGEDVFLMEEYRGTSLLRVLVRPEGNLSDGEYRILSLNNAVNGWESGNGFAAAELGTNSPVNSRSRYWKDVISELIQYAGGLR